MKFSIDTSYVQRFHVLKHWFFISVPCSFKPVLMLQFAFRVELLWHPGHAIQQIALAF